MGLIKKDYIDGVTPTSAQNLNDIQDAIVTLEEQTGREANMALKKVNYIEGETPITAQNLNDIQDAILGLEEGGGDYEAGANDFGYKAKVEGNPATLNYVHPKEHKVSIKTTATDHKVYIRGKNLLNLEGREVVNFGTGGSTTKRTFFNEKAIILGIAVNNAVTPADYDFEITENTISCTQKQASYGMGFDVKLLPNTTYRFSSSERTPNSSVRLIEYDAEGNYIKNTTIVSNGVTTTANTAWGVFMFKADTANYEHYISNPQLEYGSVITEYEPPIPEAEYIAGADGTVEGVKSISPTMNITTDKAGAVINAECFLDPQAVITSLTNTVITLGGEV